MAVIQEYLRLQYEYSLKYGKNTVVLMQIGDFYELYEYNPEFDETLNAVGSYEEKEQKYTEKVGLVTELREILHCERTSKNKNKPHSVTNPYMSGFPLIVYEEKKKNLIKNRYIVIKVDQIDLPNTNKKDRKVTEIISLGTEMESDEPMNYIMSLYIENHSIHMNRNKLDENSLVIGVSYIDSTTGESSVREIHSKQFNKANAIQELYRYILSISPKEIIININKFPNDKKLNNNSEDNEDEYKNYLYAHLELNKIPYVIFNINQVNKEYLDLNYHKSIFRNIFAANNPNFVLSDLELDRKYYGSISYILLLTYCYEHNASIITNLKRPSVEDEISNNNLILTHNAIKQLNINSNSIGEKVNGINSLISLIDNTLTRLGKEHLTRVILNPLTNREELQNYYDITEEFCNNKDMLKKLRNLVSEIGDLRKFYRRMQLYIIKPKEFANIFNSYTSIQNIYEIIDKSNLIHCKNLIDSDKLLELMRSNNAISSIMDFNVLAKFVSTTVKGENGKDKCLSIDWTSTSNLVKSNAIPNNYITDNDIKTTQYFENLVKTVYSQLNNIIEHLSQHVKKNRGNSGIKLERKEYKRVQGYNEIIYIQTTSAKVKSLKIAYDSGKIDTNLCGNLIFIKDNSKMKISSNVIDTIIKNLSENIINYFKCAYVLFMKCINITLQYEHHDYIFDFISKLDYILSNAYTALKYKYYKPILMQNSNKSQFEIKNIRHPIIERIIDTEYITNDINLGSDIGPFGLLLYGTNSSGKSSLAKAIGLNIILAQAGCFTACQLTYTPYNRIITRLSSEDDIFKGQSSFIVELSEIRTILRNSDKNTLIIGDEPCRGTESISATSIVLGIIFELIKRKSTFIFSTHLHSLVDYIKSIPDNHLQISHLTVHYNEKHDTLIYDRKLNPGSGESVYGIEVAKSIGLESSFIDLINNIRSNIDNSNKLFNTKKSKYNSKVYVDSCHFCKSKENLETHHIQEQHLADNNGFINNFHKNQKHNLIVLCESCHQNLHLNNLQIKTEQTVTGHIYKTVQTNPRLETITQSINNLS